MTTLHMQTENVRTTARQMMQSGDQAALALQSLGRAIQALQMSWEGGSSEEFEAEAQDVLRRLNTQVDLLLELAGRVDREVTEWDAVDQSGARTLQPGISRFFFTLPTVPFSAGGDKGSINILPILPLPFAISIGSFFRSIPDWFSSFLDDFFEKPSIASPLPADPGIPVIDSPPRTAPTTGFGDLLKESPAGTPSAEPVVAQSNNNSPRYDIPIKSQGDLYGNAACAPTSVSMVLDYYHAQDPSLQTASPSELISMLDKGDGTFGSGVGLHLMNDDLNQLGYHNITVKSDANLDDLSTALNDGPVIVTAGVKLIDGQARDIQQAGNRIHAMVVKDMNTESVILNDPWSGAEKIFSRDTFSKMWAKGEHGMYVIRP